MEETTFVIYENDRDLIDDLGLNTYCYCELIDAIDNFINSIVSLNRLPEMNVLSEKYVVLKDIDFFTLLFNIVMRIMKAKIMVDDTEFYQGNIGINQV